MFLVPQIFVLIPTYNEYHPDSCGPFSLVSWWFRCFSHCNQQ